MQENVKGLTRLLTALRKSTYGNRLQRSTSQAGLSRQDKTREDKSREYMQREYLFVSFFVFPFLWTMPVRLEVELQRRKQWERQ